MEPDLDLQNHFETIVEMVEDVKSQYQQSLTELENLYGALNQKAFKGELDLSQIVAPKEQKAVSEEMKSVAPVTSEIEPQPVIELPALIDLNKLNSEEGLKVLIDEWLEAYLEQLGEAPFSVDYFIETAQIKMWDILEDDVPELGVAEYDYLKNWIFQALKSGHLIQAYDNAKNRVRISPAKD